MRGADSFEAVAPDAQGARSGVPTDAPADALVTPWSVRPTNWGDFLNDVFDEWLAHDRGRVKVNLFEAFLLLLTGQPSPICTSSPFWQEHRRGA